MKYSSISFRFCDRENFNRICINAKINFTAILNGDLYLLLANLILSYRKLVLRDMDFISSKIHDIFS